MSAQLQVRDHAEIERAINEIAQKQGGRITPEEVVTAARDEDSPLHCLFEWENDEAARKYRLIQARLVLRVVRVNITTDERTVRTIAYVRDPGVPAREQGYISTVVLRTERQRAAQAVYAEAMRAHGALVRAREVAAVLGLEDLVDELMAGVSKLAERAKD